MTDTRVSLREWTKDMVEILPITLTSHISLSTCSLLVVKVCKDLHLVMTLLSAEPIGVAEDNNLKALTTSEKVVAEEVVWIPKGDQISSVTLKTK
jgi:hypothetical protein